VLLEASRGIPMVLQLLVQDWHRNGSASLAISVGSMTEQVSSAQVPEGTYHHILKRLLGELDPPTLLVLRTASILGSRLDDLTLYALTDLAVSQTMMGLGELTKRHILRESPSGLDFANELVRGQAYSQMPLTLRRAIHGLVANALLQRIETGQEGVRGLETAWHLVRGGRAAEAAPHLLRGAREAIREGAPHEAELALGSALEEAGLLEGEPYSEACLLLCEVRQELSQWSASQTALTRLREPVTPDQQERLRLLSLVAQRNLYHTDGRDLGMLVAELIDLATTFANVSVRTRALVLAAGTMDQTHSIAIAPAIWPVLEMLTPLCETVEEKAHLLTARGLLHFHGRDIERSRADVALALDLLESSAIHSTPFVSLILGLSALACADGRYTEALEHAERAYGLASRLDHDRLMLRAAGNAALAHGRLGNYREQYEWGLKKIRRLGPSTLDPERMRTAWMIGMARAMLGEVAALDEFRACLPVLSERTAPWIRQTTALMEADLLQLLGRRQQALRAAREATSGDNQRLHSPAYAGPYARWIALLAVSGEDVPQNRARLLELVTGLDGFDRIDRVEILCAARAVGLRVDDPKTDITESMRRMLAALPPAVADQIERLGFPL